MSLNNEEQKQGQQSPMKGRVRSKREMERSQSHNDMSLVDLIKAEMFRESVTNNKNMFDFNEGEPTSGAAKNFLKHNQSNDYNEDGVKLSPMMD